MRFPFNQQSNPYEAKFTLCNKVARLLAYALGRVYSRGEERREEGKKEARGIERATRQACETWMIARNKSRRV